MEVAIQGLRLARGTRFVLDIPRLRFAPGRLTAILGPNGSGKTTLLRLVAGLERPGAGSVLVGGGAPRAGPARSRHLAYAFQEAVLLRGSVRFNLDLGLRLRGLPPAERASRIDAWAARLAIGGLLDRRSDTLSGGEAQRVNLARALLLETPVLLLDEPLAGIDGTDRLALLDTLRPLLRRDGGTTLLVTHYREEALRAGDDLVVLVEGRVRAAGPKGEVAASPPDATVAAILGWTLLDLGGERLGVPPGGLRPGPGPHPFEMQVEDLVDLVESREAIGRIGDTPVRVLLARDAPAPRPGSRLTVSASRVLRLA